MTCNLKTRFSSLKKKRKEKEKHLFPTFFKGYMDEQQYAHPKQHGTAKCQVLNYILFQEN